MLTLSRSASRTAAALSASFLMAPLALMPGANCRASVVSTFANATSITINDAPSGDVAKASLYPSVIHVSGITANTITKARIVLNDFSHTFPDDVDILLVAPDGTRSVVMSDAGGNVVASHLTLSFSATGVDAVPDDTAISSDPAPIRPANYAAGDASLITDIFPAPGPGTFVMKPADFDAFNGVDPNGDWSLYVVDDSNGDGGSIAGGWTLQLTVPSIYTVTKIADTNDGNCDTDCSLREAIAAAGGGDLIRFASPLFDSSQTITLDGAQIDIATSVTIEGPGADKLSISGNFASRVFSVTNGLAVTLKGMTIREGRADIAAGILSAAQMTLDHVALAGNKATGLSGLGGAVYQTGNGNFIGCTFSDNRGGLGGAIFFANAQVLRLVNTTISGNRGDYGGGVYVSSANATDVRLDVIDSTLVDNLAGLGGAMDFVTQNMDGSTETVTFRNSIVANNAPANLYAQPDNGPIIIRSQGFNLTNETSSDYFTDPTDILGVDPKLGPLNNNGGHVETRALLGGSPALDAGHSSGYPRDVRGQSRSFDALGALSPPGDYSDIGAAEMHAIFVGTTADGGAGSLRLAMGIANLDGTGQDDILFDPNVFGTTPQTINLTGELPGISTSLSVNGPGAKLLTVRRETGGDYRIFNDDSDADELAFTGLTVSNGRADSSGGGIRSLSRLSLAEVTITGNTDPGTLGGGGLVLFGADATIKDSTLDHNATAGFGGGVLTQGAGQTLRLSNVTISDNQAASGGGGVSIVTQGATSDVLDVVNSTIANNSASFNGGIDVFTFDASSSATARLRNSIVANNTPQNFGTGIQDGGVAAVVSRGYNLTDENDDTFLDQATDKIGADPLLVPLAYNGGPTRTRALLGGSPAIDGGDSSGSVRDQRGQLRAVDFAAYANAGDFSDIGAFEYQDVIFANSFED